MKKEELKQMLAGYEGDIALDIINDASNYALNKVFDWVEAYDEYVHLQVWDGQVYIKSDLNSESLEKEAQVIFDEAFGEYLRELEEANKS